MNGKNQEVRELFNTIMEENGLKLIWIVEMMGLKYSSVSRWRGGSFDFGKEKVLIIEEFLKRYEK